MMAADDEIEEQLRTMLAIRHLPSLNRIAIRVVDGVVFLAGSVMTYFERNVCEECCRQIPGFAGVCNEIVVGGSGLRSSEAVLRKEVPPSECETPGAAVIP
ncbi:MAG: BON domain-containing protein [Pirellulales bacterium]|jgi:osmotically-inducible protein OsmY